jgi:hypothetical protein
MIQHTPGPWTFNETIPRMVSSKEGYITRDICRMDDSTMSAFNQNANARLIAAAPDLLEAVQDLLDNVPPLWECAERAQAIVDKLTGTK